MSYRNGPGVEQGHRQNHARQALPRGSIVPPPLSRVHYRMRPCSVLAQTRRCLSIPLCSPASRTFRRAQFKISQDKRPRAVSALRAPL